MKSITSVASVIGALCALMLTPASARTAPVASPVGPEADYPVTIGEPYVIGGVTYTPADTLNYDAVGYARAGTDGSGISGAHHALPLPCYVEVTSLDSGHTILVRLDRRGPMNGKQLIELSPAAWAQLGLPSGADAPVRVRRVNPPEQERASLRAGGHAQDRMETPPGLRTALRRKLGLATPATPDEPPAAILSGATTAAAAPVVAKAVVPTPPAPPTPVPAIPKPPAAKTTPPPAKAPTPQLTPKPAPKPAPEKAVAPKSAAPKPATPKPEAAKAKPAEQPAAKSLVIQVAAFSTKERAEKAAAQVGGKVEPAGKLWRVRIVASSDDQARAALAKAKQSGYAGAMILHHE